MAVRTAGDSPALITKRVTCPVAADGSVSQTALTDWTQRVLLALPVTTTRWRLRFRNANGLTSAVYTGAIHCTGVYLGDPVWQSTSDGWSGVFTATPTLAVLPFDSATDGSEYTSEWVTDPTLQWSPGKARGLSWGCTCATGQQVNKSGPGSLIWYGTAGTNPGVSQYAGTSAVPASGSFTTAQAFGDFRIEYEFQTPAVGGLPVVLAVGDSITAGLIGQAGETGLTSANSPGVFPHETWIGAACMRAGVPWVNLGVASSKMGDYASATSAWRYARADLATTVPDIAIIALGSNDAVNSVSLASYRSSLATVVANLRSLGIQRIFYSTTIPRALGAGAATELLRLSYNQHLRAMPAGAAGVFDFDKAVYVQATPDTCDADYMYAYPHPQHAGYQKMAHTVVLPRIA